MEYIKAVLVFSLIFSLPFLAVSLAINTIALLSNMPVIEEGLDYKSLRQYAVSWGASLPMYWAAWDLKLIIIAAITLRVLWEVVAALLIWNTFRLEKERERHGKGRRV